MAIEIFLAPLVGAGTLTDPIRPKYSDDPQVVRSGSIRYSKDSNCICLYEAPQPYLNSIASQPDATRLASASNIDQTLNANQANTAKVIFEAAFIPGQFINAGDTRRQVIRGVVGMFLFSQRMEGRFGEGWQAKAVARGVTLDSPWSTFPQVLKDELIAVRDSFGWTNAELGVTNTSTMREILQAISAQFENKPIFLAGVEI